MGRLLFFIFREEKMKRVYNFNAGPSPMPLEVLEELQQDLTDFRNTGMGITEISHRSDEFQDMLDETKADLHELMHLGDDYKIVFIQGGGTMQFLMTAANFLHTKGAYADTGVWTQKAKKTAAFFGEVYDASSAADKDYSYIPDTVQIRPDTDYLYLCSNNTIYGTEYKNFPKTDIPIIADMSSDILSREIDFNRFSLIWAGIQKNLGAAGCAFAAIREDFLEKARTDIPEYLQYRTFVAKDSTYNTPPVFCIYTLNRMLHWIKGQGGLPAVEERNKRKAQTIYDVIDASDGFYKGHADKKDRSRMNITFNLADPAMEKDFIARAGENDFVGIKGHRLIGGLRISLYNAVTPEAASALAEFMKEYARKNG